MEEAIKALLETVSKIPVLDVPTSDVFPCVTFHFFGEGGGLFGGGKAQEETASCQVDIWYETNEAQKQDVTDTIKAIKQAVINAGYTYPSKVKIYEPGARKWHVYFTFDLIKESEE